MRLLYLLEDFRDELEIVREKAYPGDSVCTIGKSKKNGKWYGWSHRAYHGFEVGDRVEEGDAGYTEEKGEWTAKTEQDARQMAIDFAEGVG